MFDLFISAREVLLVMVSRSVASALTLLTSKSFSFVPSDSPDNDNLEALVSEYFTGSDEITDCEDSDSDVEGILYTFHCIFILDYRQGEAEYPVLATTQPQVEEEENDFYNEGNLILYTLNKQR